MPPTLLKIAVFATTGVATALLVARLVGGPGARDTCTGDECEANGVPVGIVVGLVSVMLLDRLRGR